MKLDDVIKKEIEEDMKKIQAPSSLYDFAKNIKNEVNSEEKPVLKRRFTKESQFVAAAVIGFGVITASAFFNPSVAEMASKIPYLGQVFKSKSIDVMLWEALEKEGYQKFSLGMTPGEVVKIEVLVEGSETDADRERENITGIAKEVLHSKGYDSYEIKVGSYKPEYIPLTEEEIKMEELGGKLDEELKKAGYKIINVNPFNETIEVAIPMTEKRSEEILKATRSLAKANGSEKEVEVTKVDLEKKEREGLWMDYLRSIHEGLALKKEYKVSGYGYSYKQNTLKMIIKTSMKPGDGKSEETVRKIRTEITQFIESERKNSVVKDDEYEIVIRDKSGNDFPF
ncbi:DUF4030 domain-containing protein [Mesobacillus boroniphilus]|uniref:DUF4030 domain-containing protein n=1 Tax=Mesobacillus boroniphilus TaxID=308892 RepID=A0A944CKW1_9BACI|nr:hypothetical protein [Mesobacillus boroniphilus]MBS8263643.1 DUF4030 domain-containing protein [Mesobacillus boroniphilus]